MANIAELVWRSPDHKRCEIHYNNIVRIVSTEDLKGMIKGGYLEVKGWRLDAKGRLIRTPEVTFPRIAPKTFLMIYSNREIMALFEDFSCNSNEDMHYYKSEKIYDKLQEIFKKFSSQIQERIKCTYDTKDEFLTHLLKIGSFERVTDMFLQDYKQYLKKTNGSYYAILNVPYFTEQYNSKNDEKVDIRHLEGRSYCFSQLQCFKTMDGCIEHDCSINDIYDANFNKQKVIFYITGLDTNNVTVLDTNDVLPKEQQGNLKRLNTMYECVLRDVRVHVKYYKKTALIDDTQVIIYVCEVEDSSYINKSHPIYYKNFCWPGNK